MESLLLFDNPDKAGRRPSGLAPFMPDWPFRLLLAGPPGSGKRNLCLNLVFRLTPPPSAIHIVHYDSEGTREYEEVEALGRPVYYYSPDDLPTVDNLASPEGPPIGDLGPLGALQPWGPYGTPVGLSEEKTKSPSASLGTDFPPCAAAGEQDGDSQDGEGEREALGEAPLVIFDEVTRDVLTPEQASRLERLLNYGSTHKNTSVITSIQDITNIPPKSRRAFDHFALWNSCDKGLVQLAANRVGISADMLRELFQLCRDRHDSIWIDANRAPEDQYRFRLNFISPIRTTRIFPP